LGLARQELGESDQAKLCLERAVILEPTYADVHYQLGLIYSDQGRYQLAVEHFQDSLRQSDSNVQVAAALAQALENIGLTDLTGSSWKAVLELADEEEQAKLAETTPGN